MSGLVLGIDIGGTGSRVALADLDSRGAVLGTFNAPGVSVGAEGSSAPRQIRGLVSAAREAWPEHVDSIRGIGIGATGIASLSTDVGELARSLVTEASTKTAVAIDAVTAHLGALGGHGGTIVVLGTGAIGIAHPGPDDQGVFSPRWSRVDGWGHLFGDRGGGAWIGRHALEAALRTHDGVSEAGRGLLEAATGRFGPPASWPAQFYTRDDRAGRLADFAADVAPLARTDDAAAELMGEAGREAARTALAASAASATSIALTGGLAQAGGRLVSGFREEVASLNPGAVVVEPEGDPLGGALLLGRLAAEGKLHNQDTVLWT
ncbi:MAG: hypothetical protein L0I80_12595 [Brevibacterium sp.]|uniref:N-acetylglucosamine kinase n=1 Tax=Brevibacterium sp. TaxID=1701 RepID=UPI00264A3DDB|nr:BadF/BadG/BcrA/BcrD ATPase family protein [Brevibacterium sp.]MDN5806995.1 hypothetical protein [Brevibacterium sp.]MDN5832949.1 hypothetical protein [Brevibacterium sp.]MDN5875272.1 hypothetical protein [Brevibacterium sp.]MDN5908369.1 hypothetical protein [Brevibacterium sp.]MDN6124686.1 hypothetical protein [Brevibacterium sp.]